MNIFITYIIFYFLFFIALGKEISRRMRIIMYLMFPLPVSVDEISDFSSGELFNECNIPDNNHDSFLIILPLFLAIPFLIIELKGMLSGEFFEFHLSYLFEKPFTQNFYFLHLLFIILSILILNEYFKSFKLLKNNIVFLNTSNDLETPLNNKKRIFLTLIMLAFAILLILFSNTLWYESKPLLGAFIFILLLIISYLILFRVILKTLNRFRFILLFIFLILLVPNVSVSSNCLHFTSIFDEINFKYPVIKPNLSVLIATIQYYFFNNCITTKENIEELYMTIRDTENVSVLYGIFFFIFIIYTQIIILKRKLYALKQTLIP